MNKEQAVKILKGAAVAAAGAAIVSVAQVAMHTDFGAYTPFVVALASALVNIGKVLMSA